jgi:hypothetical protein
MNKLLLVAAALFAGIMLFTGQHGATSSQAPPPVSDQAGGKSEALVADALSRRDSNQQISGQGIVVKLLADDTNGSKHQKFIVRLSSGQTILIAHNIDLAPRISSLRVGDTIAFYGEYEWNEKGGVLHWTHRDPNGSHVAGWLQHQGRRYQ